MLLSPDVSRILRVPEDVEPEEFYDHPLHSTAVDDQLEKECTQSNVSPNISKALPQVPGAESRKHLQKAVTSERKLSKTLTEASDKPTVQKNRNIFRKTKAKEEEPPFTSLKTGSISPKSNNTIVNSGSQDNGSVEAGNLVQSHQDDATPNSENLSQTPADTVVSVSEDGHQERKTHLSKKGLLLEGAGEENSIPKVNSKSKGKKRKKSTHHKSLDSTDDAGPSHTTILSPEGMQRSSKDLTELDVVLDRFKEIITNYKQTVKSSSVRKAIDLFFSTMKKNLNRTSEDVHKLKNLKKKNAKIHIEINKKRQRLIDVKEERIVNELKKHQLLKEYNDLEQKKSSFKNATQFLHDLQELQRTYLSYKEQNQEEKEEYGISSLPALLLEARPILEAEKHLQNINRKLQHWLDLEKESENLIQKN